MEKKEFVVEMVLITDETSNRQGTIEFRGENSGIMAKVYEDKIEAAEKRGEERVIRNFISSMEKIASNFCAK